MTISDVSQTELDVEDEEVVESMNEVLDALLDAMPILASANPDASDAILQGRIDILSEHGANMTVRVEESTAMKLAVGWSLVGDDGVPTSADAVDAMSEFTNLVGGSMKFLLSEESALGLPTVETAVGDLAPDSWHWIDVFHELGQFQVELHPATE